MVLDQNMASDEAVEDWRHKVQAHHRNSTGASGASEMQGQQSPAGTGSGTPPGGHRPGPGSNGKLSTPLQLLAVLLAVIAAVLFRNFFPVSSPSQNLDLSTTKLSTSVLVETLTTTVTENLPAPTQESIQTSTMSASEQTCVLPRVSLSHVSAPPFLNF